MELLVSLLNMSPLMRAPGRGRRKALSGKGYGALGAQQCYKISVQCIDP